MEKGKNNMNDFILENVKFTMREGKHDFAMECLEKAKSFTGDRVSPVVLYYPKFGEYGACIFVENQGRDRCIIGLDVNPEYKNDVKSVDIKCAVSSLDSAMMVRSYINNSIFVTNSSSLMRKAVEKLGWIGFYLEKESSSCLYAKMKPNIQELAQYSCAETEDQICCRDILGELLYTMNVDQSQHRNKVDVYDCHIGIVKETLLAIMENNGFIDELKFPFSFRTLVSSEIFSKDDNYSKMFSSSDF